MALEELGWAADVAETDSPEQALCDYKFDPEEWRDEYAPPPIGDGPGRCDRPSLEYSDLCRFHASADELDRHGLNQDDVFADYVVEHNDVIGANFGSVSFAAAQERLDEFVEISLLSPKISKIETETGRVAGRITVRHGVIGGVYIDDVSVEGSLVFHNCHLESPVYVGRSDIDGHLGFPRTKLDQWLYLYDTTVAEGVDFTDVQSYSDIVFHDCTVGGPLNANPVSMINKLIVSQSHVSEFDCQITDHETTLIRLDRTTIDNGHLRPAREKEQPDEPNYSDRVERLIELSESAKDAVSSIRPRVGFRLSISQMGPSISESSERGQQCSESAIKRYRERLWSRVTAAGAAVSERVRQYVELDERSPEVLYDLRGATLRDVTLHSAGKGLRNFYFSETNLDQFDLISHQSLLKQSGWNLHEFNDKFTQFNGDDVLSDARIGPLREQPTSVRYQTKSRLRDFESAYIYGTRAAEKQGDYVSAARFFTRQSRAQKLINRRQIRNPNPRHGDSRVRHLARYLKSVFLQYTCNFGESPLRTFAWTGIIIGMTTMLYPWLGGIKNGSTEIAYGQPGIGPIETLVDSIYYSTATFSTLGYGDFAPTTVPTKLLAGGEALAGTVLTALFIFTLSRAMKR